MAAEVSDNVANMAINVIGLVMVFKGLFMVEAHGLFRLGDRGWMKFYKVSELSGLIEQGRILLCSSE